MKYDIKKMIEEQDGKKSNASEIIPAEMLIAAGVKPKFKPTQGDLENAQRLIAGAARLMSKRVAREVEPGISQRQFGIWQSDIQNLSKQVITGFKSYNDLYEFIQISINMMDEIEPIK